MSTKMVYRVAHRLQSQLLEIGHPINQAPRVLLDSWASLTTWNQSGERIWRISEEQAERLLDEPLPQTLLLATAPTRGPSVLYQLPEKPDWIILARIPAHHLITVYQDLSWAYAQPVLTYCTPLDSGALSAGYFNLLDQPTPADIRLLPGASDKRGPLTAAEITEEDFRLSLAISQHYRP